MSDTEFLEDIAACRNIDEVLVQFRSHGVDAAPIEIEEFIASQSVIVCSSELTADDLDTVSGGSVLSAIYGWYKKLPAAVQAVEEKAVLAAVAVMAAVAENTFLACIINSNW